MCHGLCSEKISFWTSNIQISSCTGKMADDFNSSLRIRLNVFKMFSYDSLNWYILGYTSKNEKKKTLTDRMPKSNFECQWPCRVEILDHLTHGRQWRSGFTQA